MRIVDYEITTVHIPLATPFVTALRRVEAATALRLRIVTEDGRVGVGEAPPTEAITGESLDSIRAAIENDLLPFLMEPFENFKEALARLHALPIKASSAKAAVDIALHDLFAPIAETIRIETAVTVSLNAPEAMERQALEFARRGCRILKVKLGADDNLDASRIRRIRETLPEVTLLADANQAWSEAETLRFLEEVQRCNVALLEQPLPARDLAGMARVTAQSPLPILADESAFDLAGVRKVVEMEAADMINVKLMKCGGIAPGKEILQWCEARNIPCMMGSMLETPASIRAAAILASRYHGVVRYCDLDSPLLWRWIPTDSKIETEGCKIIFNAHVAAEDTPYA